MKHGLLGWLISSWWACRSRQRRTAGIWRKDEASIKMHFGVGSICCGFDFFLFFLPFFAANSFWLIAVNLSMRGVHFRRRAFEGMLTKVLYRSSCICGNNWVPRRLRNCVDILLICSLHHSCAALKCGPDKNERNTCVVPSSVSCLPCFHSLPLSLSPPQRTVSERSMKRRWSDQYCSQEMGFPFSLCVCVSSSASAVFCLTISLEHCGQYHKQTR